MKKVIFSLVLLVFTATSFAQKWEFHHFTVNANGMATVYFTNESGGTMVRSIKAVINHSKYDQSGNLTGGNVQFRDGLMLTPPIRPQAWIKNDNGSISREGFTYNTGFTERTATVLIIEGSLDPNGKTLNYNPREVVCDVTTWNPGNWVLKYPVNNYEIPNFVQVMTVSKNGDGSYSAR